MSVQNHFQQLAKIRLQEAELLLANNFHSGAYYYGGIAVEIALKGTILKMLGISNLPKQLEIHDLNTLFIFAGLSPAFQSEKVQNTRLFRAWNNVSGWKVDRRYEAAPANTVHIENFMKDVKMVFTWIEKHW